MRNSKNILLNAIIFGSAVFYASSSKAIVFDFSTAPASSSSSTIVYTISGVTLTANSPAGANNPVMQRNTNGICALMVFSNALNTAAPYCGQQTTASQTLTSFKITFNQNVNLKSFTTAATSYQDPVGGQVQNGTIAFSPRFSIPAATFVSPVITVNVARLTDVTFTNANGGSPCTTTVGSSTCRVLFTSDFIVPAGQEITVDTSSFNTTTPSFATPPNGSWRLFSLEADTVPGPLPVLGAGAAFAWSRRIRRRITAKA